MKHTLVLFVVVLILISIAVPTATAMDPMSVAQQNTLVQKYCAVCHTDAARNGGLSLQHFDAAEAAPSLAAMLVSKLGGGAMGAAGIKVPDKDTTNALVIALTSKAAGAREWAMNRT